MATPLAPWHSNQVHMYCICARAADPRRLPQKFIRLPIQLQKAINARLSAISKKIRFSYCDVKENSSGSEEVDVLIFPNMVQYKGLTASDFESFVEEVLVQGNEWTAKRPEKVKGVHVFVCARSYVSDILINEVANRGLDQVIVNKCTHIYGEKYTGNVVVYTPDFDGEYAEHCWYDYVTVSNIFVLVDEFLSKGKTIEDNVWKLSIKENEEAQNGDDHAAPRSSFSSFASWIKENVPWSALAAAGVMGALVGFTLSKKSK